MNPEERKLLERTYKLAEENNEILRKVNARARRAALYGFIKLLIVIAPLVLGYYFLEPYINQGIASYDQAKGLLDTLSR